MIKTIPVFADWDTKEYSVREMYWRLKDIVDFLWMAFHMSDRPKNAAVLTAEEIAVKSHIDNAITQVRDALVHLAYTPTKTEVTTRVAEKQGQTVQVSQLRRDPITEEVYIAENKPDDKTGCTGLNPHLTRRPNWEEELRAKLADAITVDIAPEVEQMFNELDALGQPKYDANGDEILRYTSSPGIGKSEYLKPEDDGSLRPEDVAGYLKIKGQKDVIEKGYLVMRDALDELTQRIQEITIELDELEPDPDPLQASPNAMAMLKSIITTQTPDEMLKMLATAYAEAAMDEVLESGEIALRGNQQLYRAAFWAVERSKAEYKRSLKEEYK